MKTELNDNLGYPTKHFASLKEHILYIITGTETPHFLSEREKVMVDKFIEFYTTVKTGVIEGVAAEFQRTIPGLKFDDLKEDGIYSMYSIPYNISNRVRLVTFDTTPLNRRIAYFQYVDRGQFQLKKEHVIRSFREDTNVLDIDGKKVFVEIFALYDSEIESGDAILTPSK
jgi:hypothetical protein